ncbi:MAG TPA: ABC transporter permease [Bacteroidetes bacterium]|nr:ABC transporter permease [Ignavibacteria bacterium]HCA42731.1 ABC transporter permease [Bacteroidota bacterium]HCN38385.1 ABC transporter permease [Bacteroidota bacterium]
MAKTREISFFGNFKFVLPAGLNDWFEKMGDIFFFIGRFFKELFIPRYEIKESIRQCFVIGYKSLGLVGITGFIIGLTLTLQSIPTLSIFGAQSLVPSMVAIAVFREIGPVITALIFAGKIGSGIGAELGSMKVTEQIDAMEVSGTSPFKYLVVTRVVASTLMLPILIFFADALAMVGSYISYNLLESASIRSFLIIAFQNIGFADIVPATIKSIFFGFFIGIIGCYEGYNADRGTESVGIAANTAVVLSSLSVILLDMIAVQISSIF